MSDTAGRVADATGNWVEHIAPEWSRPYLRLARLDRPIGSWLLLLPCWWSVALAVVAAKGNTPIAVSFVFFFSVFTLPNPIYLLLFFIGAFAMGGAGCTWNDILDRNIDAQVARTRARPIPSGQAPSGASTYSLGVRIS